MRLKILLLGLCAGALTACANYDLPYIGRTNEAAANDHRIIVLGQELKGGEKSARFVELVRNAEKARNIDHGASGLILRAALEGGLDGETNLDKVLEQPGDARCAEAKIAKINFHKANGGEIPPAFGKIITVELDQFDDPYWAGYIDLCTWIKTATLTTSTCSTSTLRAVSTTPAYCAATAIPAAQSLSRALWSSAQARSKHDCRDDEPVGL